MDVATHLNRLDSLVEEHGHAVQGVFGDQDGPSFCYTVGLWRKGWPEVIVVGLSPAVGQAILNSYVEQCAARGRAPAIGELVTEVANLPLTVGSVGQIAQREYTAQAMYHCSRHGGAWLGAVQLVLCDKKGKFPLEQDYDIAHMGPLQTCLSATGQWDYTAGGTSAATH